MYFALLNELKESHPVCGCLDCLVFLLLSVVLMLNQQGYKMISKESKAFGGIREEEGEGGRKGEGGCEREEEGEPQGEGSKLSACKGVREINVCNAGWESEEENTEVDKEENDIDEMPDKDDFFFEGAEKLLEVWFTTTKKSGSECDLRNIPRFE